ncbi:hypothetical protein FSP39_016330 [Pinctada imbricata]|uniref:Uncharacterized protein n=1 Tax=Pinctada imbricata TaxID=66713 RepID=A0AA88XZA4_PINIB|nr:hypothetical protein FSP39_016330 [Pinctada imbricata]
MSVPSATAAASTRTRKESRSSNPKARGTMTPKQSQIEGLEEFQSDSVYGNSYHCLKQGALLNVGCVPAL